MVYVDLVINDRKYRIVSVYVPHGGYDQIHFDTCFDHIRQTVLDGQRLGMKCMMGGDFNTELHRGWRGDRLEQLLCEVGLVICNDVSLLPFEDAWTFKSCLGTKRILDYCMVSNGIITDSSKAINDLVLRSDHRAVQSCVLLPSANRHHRKSRRKRSTNWIKYTEAALNHTCDPNGNLIQFEKELGDLVQTCEDTPIGSSSRPWDSTELQNLRATRKSATSGEERTRISKQIWRLTRKGLREHRTKQAVEKLTEFRQLEKLGKLHMCPITKTHTAGPNLESCATLLQQVYTTDNHMEYETNYLVLPFSLEELEYALKK